MAQGQSLTECGMFRPQTPAAYGASLWKTSLPRYQIRTRLFSQERRAYVDEADSGQRHWSWLDHDANETDSPNSYDWSNFEIYKLYIEESLRSAVKTSRSTLFCWNTLQSRPVSAGKATNFITRAFQRKRPSWNFGFVFFFVQPQFASLQVIRMRDDFTLMSTWHGVMADEEKFMRWKISTNTVYNTFKTDTKYSHSVRGRPTLKDEERFRNGLVRKPYERSLYERTFMS